MTVSLEEPNFHGALEPLSAYEKATKDGALPTRAEAYPQHVGFYFGNPNFAFAHDLTCDYTTIFWR
jgi:hypothetical protein